MEDTGPPGKSRVLSEGGLSTGGPSTGPASAVPLTSSLTHSALGCTLPATRYICPRHRGRSVSHRQGPCPLRTGQGREKDRTHRETVCCQAAITTMKKIKQGKGSESKQIGFLGEVTLKQRQTWERERGRTDGSTPRDSHPARDGATHRSLLGRARGRCARPLRTGRRQAGFLGSRPAGV